MKKKRDVTGVLLLAVAVGFSAGIFYSATGVTGLVVEQSIPPIADLSAVDAFIIKQSEYNAVVGKRPLQEVKPEELTPYRATESRLLERIIPKYMGVRRGRAVAYKG